MHWTSLAQIADTLVDLGLAIVEAIVRANPTDEILGMRVRLAHPHQLMTKTDTNILPAQLPAGNVSSRHPSKIHTKSDN